MENSYNIVKAISRQISDIVGYSPRQPAALFHFMHDGIVTDKIMIGFNQEIKDGRSINFNLSAPLKLKGKTLGNDDFKIKVNDINFYNSEEQESDSDSRYIDFYYIATISIKLL